MSDQRWRTDVDAGDYFLHQKKTVELADRRPVIRRSADLVGPGIGAAAVRITDFNDLLATFNGYYSSAPGASNAPNSTEAFVGYVLSDAVLGGRQVFTGLSSGTEYSRTFNRSPTDPETVGWTNWTGQRIPATVEAYYQIETRGAHNSAVMLTPPALIRVVGGNDVYERSEAGIRIRRQGVYTGMIQVGDDVGATTANLWVYRPTGEVTSDIYHHQVPIGPTFHIPFTVIVTNDQQAFSVMAQNTSGAERGMWWRFTCTRVGDAV